MKKALFVLASLVLSISMTACVNTQQRSETEPVVSDHSQPIEMETYDAETEQDCINEMESTAEMKMNVQIGSATFTATLEDNDATRELMEMIRKAPVSIDMSDYGGFEKVGPLGRSLTTDNHQTTTTAGDIVLYSGDQIVMFYGTNSWSYTRLGRIDDLTGWEDALGSGGITAVFTLAE